MGNPSNWTVEAHNEWTAHDPFGRIKPADRSATPSAVTQDGVVVLRAPRNGYASFRLAVGGAGEYRLAVTMDPPVEADLFKAWYHKLAGDEPAWLPDALVPVPATADHRLPDPDNDIPGQSHQEFWVDLFVPADAPAGEADGRVTLNGDFELPIRLQVIDATVPDADAVICNRHSFGSRWLDEQYPAQFSASMSPADRHRRRIELLHHLYRINHEHRGLLTNRGVGHANTFDAIYGPTLVGHGREKRIDDWSLFDAYHGPLLDGSAFATASPGAPRPRRPASPLWTVPTPMNAQWPADYLHWGRPGYELEFVNCVRQFDAHFRQKGWLTTHPYFFFVHKKRYRWMEWDGDEPKFTRDDAYYVEMNRLFRLAVAGSPVPWLFRIDASWQMRGQFERLAGAIDWWVLGGFARWFPDEIRAVVERGDVVWTYSGTPPITAASSGLLEHVWRVWARGLAGHCEWCTHKSCPDPWQGSDGNATQTFYPGERFGIAGPIPSARLKLQRNGVQDVTLISHRAGERDPQVRAGLAGRVPVRLWSEPPPTVRDLPPEDWDSKNLAGSQDDQMAATEAVDPAWWAGVRDAALEQAP